MAIYECVGYMHINSNYETCCTVSGFGGICLLVELEGLFRLVKREFIVLCLSDSVANSVARISFIYVTIWRSRGFPRPLPGQIR